MQTPNSALDKKQTCSLKNQIADLDNRREKFNIYRDNVYQQSVRSIHVGK